MGANVWKAISSAAVFCVGSFCYALLGILSQLSKEADGSYAYSLPSVVLLAEFVKLCVSAARLSSERGVNGTLEAVSNVPPSHWLAFLVPSFLYALNNNLDMLNNQHMDPATENLLVQGKILTTGLVWCLVFRQPLGKRKWRAIMLLFFGTALASWPSSNGGRTAVKRMYIDSFGILLVMLYISVSACAGVYNEWLYQNIARDESIHASNIRLYTIGCIFNLAAHLASSPSTTGGALAGLLDGYNRYTVGLVVTYSLMGLILAQVMKFFNNIVKLFISGASMYVSAVLSWAIFGYTPTPPFMGALVLITGAILMYNWEKVGPWMQASGGSVWAQVMKLLGLPCQWQKRDKLDDWP